MSRYTKLHVRMRVTMQTVPAVGMGIWQISGNAVFLLFCSNFWEAKAYRQITFIVLGKGQFRVKYNFFAFLYWILFLWEKLK